MCPRQPVKAQVLSFILTCAFWEASVDGQVVDLCWTKLSACRHKVLLQYSTPRFNAGLGSSGGGFCLLLLFFRWQQSTSRRKEALNFRGLVSQSVRLETPRP